MDTLPIEVFATGEHAGRTWTAGDLDAMVSNFDKLRGHVKPPLKLGHNQKIVQFTGDDGQPALGTVERLERAGEKLLAHVKNVPQFLREAIRLGRYNRVSSELYPKWEGTSYERNAKSGAKGPVLSAVAILGATPPEVKNLADLATVLATEGVQPVTCSEVETDAGAIAVECGQVAGLDGDAPAAVCPHCGQEIESDGEDTAEPGEEPKPSGAMMAEAPKTSAIQHAESDGIHAIIATGTQPGGQRMNDQDKAALFAEWQTKQDEANKTRQAELDALRGELVKLSEAKAANDERVKQLADENAQIKAREAAAALEALHQKAVHFAEAQAAGEKPRIFKTQKAMATALYEKLSDEKREGEEQSLRDLFVAFVESYPAITLGAVTREKPAQTDDLAVQLSEAAKALNVDLTTHEGRMRAMEYAVSQNPSLAPDYTTPTGRRAA